MTDFVAPQFIGGNGKNQAIHYNPVGMTDFILLHILFKSVSLRIRTCYKNLGVTLIIKYAQFAPSRALLTPFTAASGRLLK